MPWPSCKLKINTCIINVEKRHGNIVNRLIAIKHHTFTSDAHFGAPQNVERDRKKNVDKEKNNTHTPNTKRRRRRRKK